MSVEQMLRYCLRFLYEYANLLITVMLIVGGLLQLSVKTAYEDAYFSTRAVSKWVRFRAISSEVLYWVSSVYAIVMLMERWDTKEDLWYLILLTIAAGLLTLRAIYNRNK